VIEQRRTKRYDLEVPLEVVRANQRSTSHSAKTLNISSGGVLFRSPGTLDIGSKVEYVITLVGRVDGNPVHLRCEGQVVRVDPSLPSLDTDASSYAIAASLERYEFMRSSDARH
jgi:hypothetical protein